MQLENIVMVVFVDIASGKSLTCVASRLDSDHFNELYLHVCAVNISAIADQLAF
jgi:hypothetical protein